MSSLGFSILTPSNSSFSTTWSCKTPITLNHSWLILISSPSGSFRPKSLRRAVVPSTHTWCALASSTGRKNAPSVTRSPMASG